MAYTLVDVDSAVSDAVLADIARHRRRAVGALPAARIGPRSAYCAQARGAGCCSIASSARVSRRCSDSRYRRNAVSSSACWSAAPRRRAGASARDATAGGRPPRSCRWPPRSRRRWLRRPRAAAPRRRRRAQARRQQAQGVLGFFGQRRVGFGRRRCRAPTPAPRPRAATSASSRAAAAVSMARLLHHGGQPGLRPRRARAVRRLRARAGSVSCTTSSASRRCRRAGGRRRGPGGARCVSSCER